MTEKVHNFIVTGAGFIGSHLTNTLLLHGQNVLVIDDMRKGKFKVENSPNVKYLHKDVASPIPVGKYDAIFHPAATPRIRLSQNDPFGTITNNFNSTMVVEYARRERIPLFFAASSTLSFFTITIILIHFQSV